MTYSRQNRGKDQETSENAQRKIKTTQFVDNRTATNIQQQQQEMMAASSQVTAQRKLMTTMSNSTLQRAAPEEELQMKAVSTTTQLAEDEELLQGKFETAQRAEEDELLQGKFETAQRTEEEELLQGKFETAQRTEEEELLQGKFETAQRTEEEELLQGKFETAQRTEEEELLQGKFETAQLAEEEELLQGKFETAQLAVQGKFEAAQRAEEDELLQGKFANVTENIQRKENTVTNNTGLPDNLKSGIENMSGYSMDDVKVHYNSDKPAQMQAHAYAQGTNIHIAPGQEKHLPHEAWHVVQQKQGRVNPTTQAKGVAINDDVGLETEADVMGAKKLQMKTTQDSVQKIQNENNYSDNLKDVGATTQRAPVVQMFNSVPRVRLHSAMSNLHSDWTKGSDEGSMTVWQIAQFQKWDFHFTAMYDPTGVNVTKFHFTIRNGSKGDDAFAWFNVVGHNAAATLGARADAGDANYWTAGTAEYRKIPKKIRTQFANINQWATDILQTTVSYI